MNYIELMKTIENTNPELYGYMDDMLKMYIYAEKNNLLYVQGGEYNGIPGRMAECVYDLLLNPNTNRDGVKECSENDMIFKYITIEFKEGNSALAKVNKYTLKIDEKQKRPMFFSFTTKKFNPYTNLEKLIYFIPYIDYIKYMYSFDMLKLKQNTAYNRELKKQGITSNFPFIEIAKKHNKKYTEEQYKLLIKNSMNLEQFREYAKNRKAGQNVVDKRKVNRLFQKIYDELLTEKENNQ